MSQSIEELTDQDLRDIAKSSEPPRNSGFEADESKFDRVFDAICSPQNTASLLQAQSEDQD